MAITVSPSSLPQMDRISEDLKPLLSAQANISTEGPPRWSTYSAPHPKIVVNVATETDVAAVVKYCAKRDIKFLAQNGGSGWAASNFTNGVLINLSALTQFDFNADGTQATVGGGVSVKQAIDAANKSGSFILTGNCNCVGVLGAILGGGYGNLMGKYGFGVDNVVSFNLVTAEGELLSVTPESHPDLFWAVRGAGPNFGIVTSAVMKTYPNQDRTGFNLALGFTSDKITQVVETIEAMRPNFLPAQAVFLYLTNAGPPDNQAVILVTGFLLQASEEEGRAAFASLYALGPIVEHGGVLPYNEWNTAADVFCAREERKPANTVGISKLHPEQWQTIWDLFYDFRSKPGAEFSTVIIEMYNLDKARTFPSNSSAFAHRDVGAQAIVIPWYSDPSLDDEAVKFARNVRQILSSTEKDFKAYINFAYGDEGLDAVYGESLPRLQEIKKRWDPSGRFSHWFNIE